MRTTQRSASALCFLSFAAVAGAQSTPEVKDSWTDVVTLRTGDGWYAAPIHATLMPDGTVVFIGTERDEEDPTNLDVNFRTGAYTIEPSPIWSPVAPELVVTSWQEPIDADELIVPPYFLHDTLFCSGHTLTADGRLFTAGGTRQVIELTSGADGVFGLEYATLFDGTSWTRVPQNMQALGGFGSPARWYPTVTRLPDERLFVVSGLEVVLPFQGFNVSAEIFDLATGQWEVFSNIGEIPLEIYNADYTHTFLLPNPVRGRDLLLFGQTGFPVMCSTSPEGTKWGQPGAGRPGTVGGQVPNHGTSTVMLPLRLEDGEWGYSNGSVLLAGGAHLTNHMLMIDVFDPVERTWSDRIDGGVMRHHPGTVLLPDGRVFVVAGHNKAGTFGLRHGTYVDPRDGFSVKLGKSPTDEIRGYHNVSLLLPDGRVLVAGGQDRVTGDESEKTDLRYYYPSYLFARGRPAIVSAPETIHYGQGFALVTAGLPIAEVVLISLGSMTHSFDSNQRYVELEIQTPFAPMPFSDRAIFGVGGPVSANVAPPGYYMLFGLDERRVPSVARIVHLQ